jgi:pimeloyl-ACP methyl ester carboxylesterase
LIAENLPYHAAGELVTIGSHRLHIRCEGQGTPSVVFDAALGASSLSWSLVAPAVARVTRTCVYDRAGFGWSDAGPLPRTASQIAGELRLLLRAAAAPPPYLLVGHSFGGLVVRLFAARHPADVAGLVLIEPVHPEDWVEPSADQRALLERGTRLCRYGVTAARLGVARIVAALARAGALNAARGLVRVVSRGGLRREDEGILAPIRKLPPEVRAVVSHAWTQPKFFEALGSQIEAMCVSAAETIRDAPASYGALPLTVVTAEGASEHRRRGDAALARQSTRGRHVLVPDSGHWVPLDAPQAVIDAVLDMVSDVRGGRLPPSRDASADHRSRGGG